jgi:predicted dehydrogenase
LGKHLLTTHLLTLFPTMNRRTFLSTTAGLVATTAILPRAEAMNLANDRVTLAMIGVKGRGNGVMHAFAGLPSVDLKYVCDIDEKVLGERTEGVTSKTKHKPEMVKDLRKCLDDKSVDCIALGTPDHWHALPTIWGCMAGKHVYVEKPDGHNLLEGRTMVAAAKKHKKVVQLGTQSRSGVHFIKAMEYIASGKLGKVVFARAWESAKQRNLGKPADGVAPSTIDYNVWLGPAPLRPFNPLRFHGNWRWFFDYGSGDLGNDGVHRLDVARWALETAVLAKGGQPLGWPTRVSVGGGKYYFDDAQEWPDTLQVNYDFAGGALMCYEMRIWNAYHFEGESEGAAVYGDEGYAIIGNNRFRAFDPKGKMIVEESGGYHNDAGHAQNFLDCMKSGERPTADLETVGHPSSGLCHLGNAAWRAGRTLRFDPATYTFIGDKDADQYVTRPEYRKPYVLPKLSEL